MMNFTCTECHDTGSRDKSGDYLDCGHCDAAMQRKAMNDFLDKLPAMGDYDAAWLVHQRALAMAPKREEGHLASEIAKWFPDRNYQAQFFAASFFGHPKTADALAAPAVSSIVPKQEASADDRDVWRAAGRAEALSILMGLCPETGIDEYTGWSSSGSPEDEGCAHWNEEKLRELLHVDSALADMMSKAEAAYYDYRSQKDEAEHAKAFAANMHSSGRVREVLAKAGEYDLIGDLCRAAPAAANGALPELPKPETMIVESDLGHRAYSADQMRAYGQACAAAGPNAELVSLIHKAQMILARHLPPDGPDAKTTISALLGLLDGPESRAALSGVKGN